jgi:hypothetical protein
VDELRKRSEKRTSTEKDFLFIKDEIERFKKIIAEKSVSLNESVRLKEKQEADDRAKARKKELASRPEPKETVWDITLKIAAEPGLPNPTPYTNFVKTADSRTGKFRINEDSKPTKTAKNSKGDPKVAAPSEDHPGDLAKTKSVDEEDDDAEKTPAVDATLEEATRILTDYIQLYGKRASLAETTAVSK